jgi:hypothetical protein
MVAHVFEFGTGPLTTATRSPPASATRGRFVWWGGGAAASALPDARAVSPPRRTPRSRCRRHRRRYSIRIHSEGTLRHPLPHAHSRSRIRNRCRRRSHCRCRTGPQQDWPHTQPGPGQSGVREQQASWQVATVRHGLSTERQSGSGQAPLQQRIAPPPGTVCVPHCVPFLLGSAAHCPPLQIWQSGHKFTHTPAAQHCPPGQLIAGPLWQRPP